MNKEEIKEYLQRVEELELKLIEEDRDTLQWLIFGYNECARLLNEEELQNNQLKEIEKEHQKINGELREELKYTVPIVEHNKIVSEKNKENQQLKEVIEEVREYVTNHSLYEEEYDYDYEENSYLSGIDDETATKDILQILDKGVKDE